MKFIERCLNMNHSKLNAPVKFCPSCGERVNSALITKCDAEKHPARRKNADHFCVDCGKSLTS